MNYFLNEFVLDLQKNGVFITKEQAEEMFLPVKELVEDVHHTASLTDLVSVLVDSYQDRITSILNNRDLIPGYLIALQVGDMNIQFMDGFRDFKKKERITENSLFDIASCSKLFTQIIIYNLVHEGAFSFDSKIGDLDKRFTYLEHLKVGDITEFLVEFKTDKGLDEVKDLEEFYKYLYHVKMNSKKKYNYNDIGMMVLKEVMEVVTGKSYLELLDKYIISKLDLKNTFAAVLEERLIDVTATPNADIGFVNDPKSIILGGTSGHAGIFANGEDLLTVSKNLFVSPEFFPSCYVKDLYEENCKNSSRAKMGNVFIRHKDGLSRSFVSNLQSSTSFQVQGSTRTTFGASKFVLSDGSKYINSNAILLNPCSMDLEYAKDLERKINVELFEKWVESDPLSRPFSHYSYTRLVRNLNISGKQMQVVDPRLMVDRKLTSDLIMTILSELSLKLMFLDQLLKFYENRYEEVKILKKSK